MSSANGKRRLTASQLRALASDTYYGDQVLLSDINRVVGLVETKFDERWVTSDSVYRLADLIDRPTCHMDMSDDDNDYDRCPADFRPYVCSRCGSVIFLDFKPHCCPVCEAEVVDE